MALAVSNLLVDIFVGRGMICMFDGGVNMDNKQIVEQSRQTFNNVRIFGVELLKYFLSVVIASIVIPIFFHDKLIGLLGNLSVCVYTSWVISLISVIFALLAFVFIFQGFYFQAHYFPIGLIFNSVSPGDIPKQSKETRQYIDEQLKYFSKNYKRSETFFSMAHYLGVFSVGSFIFSIAIITGAIIIRLFIG
jgi:hypothetical protein